MGVSIKFNNQIQKEFSDTLLKNVNEYFKKTGLSKSGGRKIIFKTVILLFLYLGSYALIMTNMLTVYQMWILTVIMGIAAAGIGMDVMHDANHGSFSDNKKINKIIGYSMELLGGNTTNWKIQHNKFTPYFHKY